ncbi:hypothetical protein BTIS_1419 [Bifidobacterium tissieri]|uniref:DUF4417 domain-containing protein n=1 Tax=Bifidobacterium tissieri TaxID=1630162 RepID=A0A261FE70_9BIFI|nr:DUF4417 domain-containing protein [Bifidobacterium tissieri]OZG57325.1 hypothetical protein BTIS_1419 [Bifidobacterium tissieri]
MTRFTLFELFAHLCGELLASGIKFTKDGYPVFPEHIMLDCGTNDIADMIDWKNRRRVESPENTVVVMFMDDELLYRRLFHLESDLPAYREFLGVTGFDLSPRIGMDPELQRFNIILSMMATIWLGLHGVQIVPNWRIGDQSTISALRVYPQGSTFAVGTLGCSRGGKEEAQYGELMLRTKLLITMPKRLFIYGPLPERYEQILNEFDTPYSHFREYRKRSYAASQLRKEA